MEEESQKGRPINFMTKLRPFHTFWLHSEIPNLNIKYLQLWVSAAEEGRGGAKKEYQLLLPRTPAIYCLPVQTPYTVFTFYSPF